MKLTAREIRLLISGLDWWQAEGEGCDDYPGSEVNELRKKLLDESLRNDHLPATAGGLD